MMFNRGTGMPLFKSNNIRSKIRLSCKEDISFLYKNVDIEFSVHEAVLE